MKKALIIFLGILLSNCSVEDTNPDIIKPLFFGDAVTSTSPTAPVSVSDGLLAYYPFDGNAADGSGYGNRGTVNGATLTTDRNNGSNRAYSFSGYNNGNTIAIANSSSLHLSQQTSLSFWLYLASYTGMDGNGKLSSYGYQALIAKDGDRGGFYIGLSGDASRNKVVLNFTNPPADGRADLPGNLQANLNRWIHIGITVNMNVIKLYYNGTLLKSQTLSAPIDFSDANAKNLFLGCFGFSTSFAPNGWYPFNGKLDEVRFYNRALSDSEIQQLANQ